MGCGNCGGGGAVDCAGSAGEGVTQRQATRHLPFGGASRWFTATLLAQDHIRSREVVGFPEPGMEAVWKITVENFPAFILVDHKGNDFFTSLNTCPVSHQAAADRPQRTPRCWRILRPLRPLSPLSPPPPHQFPHHHHPAELTPPPPGHSFPQ